GVGSVAVALTPPFPFYPPGWSGATFVINYTAILCFVIGLALIWVARLRDGRRKSRSRTSTEE
ncbi:MAG TPA: hypothetical protein VIM40_06620, partial [Arthrobacter sp.]